MTLIEEIGNELAATGTQIDEFGQARASMDNAPKQTTPEEAADALSPTVQHLDGVYGAVTAATDQVDDAAQLASAVLDGGEPGPMLSRLDSIKQELEQAASRCDSAKRHVEAALVEVGQTGEAAG